MSEHKLVLSVLLKRASARQAKTQSFHNRLYKKILKHWSLLETDTIFAYIIKLR
jgi:hypothetical protein